MKGKSRPLDPNAPNQDEQHERSHQRAAERENAREQIEQGDPPWQHERGLMAAVEAVRDLEFPLSRDEIRKHAGDRFIQTSKRVSMPLAEVLEHIPDREYRSEIDFEREVQKHWAGVKFEETRPENRPGRGG